MKLINKDALVAEIDKRKKDWQYGSSIEAKYKKEECDDILSFLDTLEVKEVDINKEMSQFIDAYFGNATIGHKLNLRRAAKHFFELGQVYQYLKITHKK